MTLTVKKRCPIEFIKHLDTHIAVLYVTKEESEKDEPLSIWAQADTRHEALAKLYTKLEKKGFSLEGISTEV